MPRRRIVGDWVIAVAVAATQLIAGLTTSPPATNLDPLGYLLGVAGGLALVVRRRAPVVVLAVTGACALGYVAAGFDVPALAYLIAVYAAVRAGHRVATAVCSVVMLVAVPLALLASPSGGPVGEAVVQARDVLPLAWLIAAGVAGEALRQAERRAEEAERSREETARRRADEERLHIARELHDSLTHQISVIKVQAEAAVHLARKRSEPVPEALLAILQASREASRELRSTLDALRDDDKNPPPGLDQVVDLVQRARSVGLDTMLTVEGHRNDVPATVDRTAYRIVQEALTNTARHGAATTATVLLDYRPDTLVIQVDDDGQAQPSTAPEPGVGLAGMRERVTALGGQLEAGPRNEGGFSVHAELPLGRTP